MHMVGELGPARVVAWPKIGCVMEAHLKEDARDELALGLSYQLPLAFYSH